MGSAKFSESVPTAARQVLAVAVVATLLAVLAIATRPAPAEAAVTESTLQVMCESVIGPQYAPSVWIPVVATNTPDQIEPGEEMSITIAGHFPEIFYGTVYWVDYSVGTWPLPPQVVSVESVSFGESEGWTPPADWTTGEPLPAGLEIVENVDGEGGFVRARNEGGEGTSSNPAVTGEVRPSPTMTITVTVDPELTDYYLEWTTFSHQRSKAWAGILGFNEGDCKPCFAPEGFADYTTAEKNAYFQDQCPGEALGQLMNGATAVGSPDGPPPTIPPPTTAPPTTVPTTLAPSTTSSSTTTAPKPAPAPTRPSYTG